MFFHPPTLHIRQPSSTTTEFTVSTRPPPSLLRTITSVLIAILRLLAVGAAALLVLLQHPGSVPVLGFLPVQLPPLDPRLLYPAAALVLYLCLQRGYTEESLLVIQSLGLQTSTTAGTWVGQGRRTRFIPTEEGWRMCRVGGWKNMAMLQAAP